MCLSNVWFVALDKHEDIELNFIFIQTTMNIFLIWNITELQNLAMGKHGLYLIHTIFQPNSESESNLYLTHNVFKSKKREHLIYNESVSIENSILLSPNFIKNLVAYIKFPDDIDSFWWTDTKSSRYKQEIQVINQN